MKTDTPLPIKKKKKNTSKLTYRQLVLSVIYREREEEAGCTLPIS